MATALLPALRRTVLLSVLAFAAASLVFGTVSEARPPIARPTVQVHDRDDVDAGSLDSVQEAVGELRDQNAPEAATKLCTSCRGFQQTLVGTLNREHELEPEPLLLVLVVPSG